MQSIWFAEYSWSVDNRESTLEDEAHHGPPRHVGLVQDSRKLPFRKSPSYRDRRNKFGKSGFTCKKSSQDLVFFQRRNVKSEYLAEFIGVTIIPPQVLLMTEFFPKGSLNELIQKKPQWLDKELRLLLLIDIVKVVERLFTATSKIQRQYHEFENHRGTYSQIRAYKEVDFYANMAACSNNVELIWM